MQFSPQSGLIDHPSSLRFVKQRRTVDGDQHAVGAGLPVGDDDVGVQMRIPAPRRLVLIRHRHQTREVDKVLLLGHRIVHPRVSSMGGEILHRLSQSGGVRVGDPLRHDIIGLQRTNHRHTLRRAERQVIAMHPLRTQGPADCPARGDPVVEPARHRPGVGLTPARWVPESPTNAAAA